MPARKKKAAARPKTTRKQVASPLSSPDRKRAARVDLGEARAKKPAKRKPLEPESDDGFVFTRQPKRTKKREPTPPSSPPANSNDPNDYTNANSTTTNGYHGTPAASNKMALPVSDTPVIRRNQKMRANPAARRRSSLGSRGKRVSSIGNGFVAVPHDEVDPRDFFKHADPDIPDPHRMKQILLWCARRTLDAHTRELRERMAEAETLPDKADRRAACGIAQVIEQELVRDLSNGQISTSWWSRPETGGGRKTLKPNAQNVTNLRNLEAFEKKLAELNAEKEQWARKLAAVSEPHEPHKVRPDWSVVDAAARCVYDGTLRRTRNDICAQSSGLMKAVEPRVDALADSVQRISAVVETSELFVESTMGQVVSQPRPQPAVSRDLLRTLSRVDSSANVY